MHRSLATERPEEIGKRRRIVSATHRIDFQRCGETIMRLFPFEQTHIELNLWLHLQRHIIICFASPNGKRLLALWLFYSTSEMWPTMSDMQRHANNSRVLTDSFTVEKHAGLMYIAWCDHNNNVTSMGRTFTCRIMVIEHSKNYFWISILMFSQERDHRTMRPTNRKGLATRKST